MDGTLFISLGIEKQDVAFVSITAFGHVDVPVEQILGVGIEDLAAQDLDIGAVFQGLVLVLIPGSA